MHDPKKSATFAPSKPRQTIRRKPTASHFPLEDLDASSEHVTEYRPTCRGIFVSFWGGLPLDTLAQVRRNFKNTPKSTTKTHKKRLSSCLFQEKAVPLHRHSHSNDVIEHSMVLLKQVKKHYRVRSLGNGRIFFVSKPLDVLNQEVFRLFVWVFRKKTVPLPSLFVICFSLLYDINISNGTWPYPQLT